MVVVSQFQIERDMTEPPIRQLAREVALGVAYVLVLYFIVWMVL